MAIRTVYEKVRLLSGEHYDVLKESLSDSEILLYCGDLALELTNPTTTRQRLELEVECTRACIFEIHAAECAYGPELALSDDQLRIGVEYVVNHATLFAERIAAVLVVPSTPDVYIDNVTIVGNTILLDIAGGPYGET